MYLTKKQAFDRKFPLSRSNKIFVSMLLWAVSINSCRFCSLLSDRCHFTCSLRWHSVWESKWKRMYVRANSKELLADQPLKGLHSHSGCWGSIQLFARRTGKQHHLSSMLQFTCNCAVPSIRCRNAVTNKIGREIWDRSIGDRDPAADLP